MVKTCGIIILPHKKQLKAKEGENLFRFLVRRQTLKPAGASSVFSILT
jgi:hypothetical protein